MTRMNCLNSSVYEHARIHGLQMTDGIDPVSACVSMRDCNWTVVEETGD